MAGHSHWAQIKRKKGANDAKRGKLFSKLAKAITIAAKAGGGDPDANLRLRYAIDAARKENMPKDPIEKAIKKGTGELGSENEMEELVYGGYGPNGVAILVECLTDNRNRTAPEVRKIFERRGGKFDDSGSTLYKFEQKGFISVDRAAATEDLLMEVAVEAGADDIKANDDDGVWEIYTPVTAFTDVRKALEDHEPEISTIEAQIIRIPSADLNVDEDTATKVLQIMTELDDHEDVNAVYTDAVFPDGFNAE